MYTPTVNPNLTSATVLSLGTDGRLRIAKGQSGAGQFVGAAGNKVLEFQATCRESQRYHANRAKALQRRYEAVQPTRAPLDAATRTAALQADTVAKWYG